jgi:exonuclease SbcD
MSLRIAHTADWHLGDKLGNQDRLGDQFERLDEILAHCDEQSVDVLLVCGDVLDEHRADPLSRIFAGLATRLRPRVENGLRCVFLAGNHDREHVFPLMRGVQEMLGSANSGGGGVDFVSSPGMFAVQGRDGTEVTLLVLPFPTTTRYGLAGERYPAADAKRAALAQAVRERLKELGEQAAAEHPERPIVVAAHVLVRGVAARTGVRELSEAEDVVIERGDLPTFSYIALGHVHQPQALDNAVRYCGSIERMDLGEANDDKGIVLVDVSQDGAIHVAELSLNATPFASIEATCVEELLAEAEAIAEPERTLVRLTLRVVPDDDLGALLAVAHQHFPRLYQHPEIVRLDEPLPYAIDAVFDPRAVSATVHGYLDEQVPEQDPDRPALIALVDQLLTEQQQDGAQ